jgi:hypothetical protein
VLGQQGVYTYKYNGFEDDFSDKNNLPQQALEKLIRK